MNPINFISSFFKRRLLALAFVVGYFVPMVALWLMGSIWHLIVPAHDLPKGLTDFFTACITGFFGPVFAILCGMQVAGDSKKKAGYFFLYLAVAMAIFSNWGIFKQIGANLWYAILSLCFNGLALLLFYQRLKQMEPDDSYPAHLLYNTTASLANQPEYPTGGPTTIIQTLTLKGFDPNGEPRIRVMANGSIYLAFSAMPPLNKQRQPINRPEFEDFSTALQKATLVIVLYQNNNCFFIPHPENDTVQNLQYYLANFWKHKAK